MRHLVWPLLWVVTAMAAGEVHYKDGDRVVRLQPVTERTAMRRPEGVDLRLYRDERGRLVGVGEGILIKLEAGASLASYLSRYRLRLVKRLGGGAWYLVATDDPARTLAIANALYDEPGVRYAMPDLHLTVRRR